MSAFANIDVRKQFPLGTVMKVNGNDYMYAEGVASTVAGSWVTFNADGITALLAANAKGRVGVAMSDCDSTSKFGWYQVYGKAIGKALAGFANGGVPYATATPGSVDDAAVAGDLIVGAIGRSALDTPVTGQAYFELDYPSINDTLGA